MTTRASSSTWKAHSMRSSCADTIRTRQEHTSAPFGLSDSRSARSLSSAHQHSSSDYLRNASQPQRMTRSHFRPSSSSSGHETTIAGEENVQDEMESAFEPPEVIMAVDVGQRGTVGCAYYAAEYEKLYFMEDVMCGGADVVDLLKNSIEPTVVIASTKCDVEVLKRLNPSLVQPAQSATSENFELPFLLQLRPSSEFNYEAARSKLLGLQIGQSEGPTLDFVVPGDIIANSDAVLDHSARLAGRQSQFLRLAGLVNVESRVTVGCAGAVLASIQRRRATTYLPGDTGAAEMHRIMTVEMFSLGDTMFISADTIYSLQIMSSETHPGAQNQGPASKCWSSRGTKEGLSVYGIFHQYAKTPQGRALLRRYFWRPSLSMEMINNRLNTIEIMVRPENATHLDSISKYLSKIKNMRLEIMNLRKGLGISICRSASVSANIWSNLCDFLYHAFKILDVLDEVSGVEILPIYNKILQRFERAVLAHLGKLINDVIDFDATKEQHRTVVKIGVDGELDEIKRTYEGIEPLLSQVAEHIAGSVPAELNSHVNVIFFPQIGFLICIRLDEVTGRGVYEGPIDTPWERMFITESNAYYKNSSMIEMDQYFGDIYGKMCDKEIEITQRLGEQVLSHDAAINEASDICGELDALLALAKGAQQYSYVRPQLTEKNLIKIEGGRHPLQELTSPNFVPNDTLIVGGVGNIFNQVQDLGSPPLHKPQPEARQDEITGPSIVVLTGPNNSGKSIYLKQVTIIVYLAHIGSYVPANSARIGMTDKILTRISTRESVSRMQSAFMIDLQQISMALNLATHRSLIVIDEFGKGTDSHDGAGLAAGVLHHLLNKGRQTPKVLGATHFHEIFEAGFIKESSTIGLSHMEVRVDGNAPEIDDRITYLHNYRPGHSNASFGTCCATMSGVARPVIERAEELVQLAATGEDLVESCAALPEAELTELEIAESIARNFLCSDIADDPRRLLDELLATTRSTTTSSRCI